MATSSIMISSLVLLLHVLAAQSISMSPDNNNTTNPFCAQKPDGLYPEPRNPSYYWRCSSNGLHGSLFLCPPSKPLWNQSSLSCSGSPPSSSSSSSNHSSCSSSSSSMPNQTIACRNTSSNNNNNNNHTLLPAQSSSDLVSTLPINNNNVWNWNGMLHCYGGGCAAPANTTTLPPDMELGIPCSDGSHLLHLAQHYASAWIPAPHFGGEDELGIQQQHWKVRFDSLEKGSPSLLTATVTGFSPDQKVGGAWQGGSGEAKFAIRGPLRSGYGACYYGLTLEKPFLGDVWAPFLQALSMAKEEEEEEPVGGFPDQQQTSYRSSRRTTVPTMQKCIRQLPWPRLLSTALCFAANANIINNINNNHPLNRLGSCISFSPSDISSLATCVSAFATLAPSTSQP